MQNSSTLIIILLVANLVATVWFGVDKTSSCSNANVGREATRQLPNSVNSEVRLKIYEDFVKVYNSNDYDALYNLFGEAAKAQFSKENSMGEFKKLSKYFGPVASGAFAYSEYVGTRGSTRFFDLHYAVKFTKASKFGDKGTLKITIAVHDSGYDIYGIRINSE